MQTLDVRTPRGALNVSRILNALGLFAMIGVLSGSLMYQFHLGEQPCPLCLVQRSGMIAVAVGPVLNLLYGMRVRHYSISILGAMAGGAGSVRQMLLHITMGDPGYGGTVFGLHLYTWAGITFIIAIAGCAVIMMWTTPFELKDNGVLKEGGWIRILALVAVIWLFVYLVAITLGVIGECGLGMCPDDPPDINPLF